MSVKERMDAEAKRAAEDRAAAMAIPKTVIEGEDAQLAAALKRVAEGRSITAFRTRNGSLVETRSAARDADDLHRLQEQGQI